MNPSAGRSELYRNPAKYLVLAFILIILQHSSPLPGSTKSFDNHSLFRPGEKLMYRAKWHVIPAGELTLEVLPIENINGKKAYHFAMITKTNEVVDLVYKVRERQDSYVDINMTHSVLYKKWSEGKHPRDVVVNFDWEKLEATRSNFGEKMTPVHIVPGTFDPLALFFVIRLRDIRENSVLEIPITEGDNNIAVKATVTKREIVEIEENKYDAFEVIPDMEKLESQRAVKKGDVPELIIWVTADDKKIPVKIQSRVRVGYFTFELVSVKP
jgi:hypothetical protein